MSQCTSWRLKRPIRLSLTAAAETEGDEEVKLEIAYWESVTAPRSAAHGGSRLHVENPPGKRVGRPPPAHPVSADVLACR